jgi:hypothetical protein
VRSRVIVAQLSREFGIAVVLKEGAAKFFVFSFLTTRCGQIGTLERMVILSGARAGNVCAGHTGGYRGSHVGVRDKNYSRGLLIENTPSGV